MIHTDPRKRFTMTDRQWNDVVRSLQPVCLPIGARERINQSIDLFHLFNYFNEADRAAPDLLKRTAAAAARLASLLQHLGERDRFAIACSLLIEAELPDRPVEARESHIDGLIKATIDQATIISQYCSDGSEIDFSKRRNDTGEVDRLLISLDYILQQFTSLRISRALAVTEFVTTVFSMAGFKKKGSIERAIARLQRSGRFSKKRSLKVTAQKHR